MHTPITTSNHFTGTITLTRSTTSNLDYNWLLVDCRYYTNARGGVRTEAGGFDVESIANVEL